MDEIVESCALEAGKAEVIWRVTSADNIHKLLERMGDAANEGAFLIEAPLDKDETEMQNMMSLIPAKGLRVVSLPHMQPDGAEIDQGKQMKGLGAASIVIMKACVGDAEDLEYSQYLVNGLTSKASSEFKFSGLTGSTNGHFGGVQANSKVSWRRAGDSEQ